MKKAAIIIGLVLLATVAVEGAILYSTRIESGRAIISQDSNKLLIITEKDSSLDTSDSTQISNAIRDGGQIVIYLNNSWMEENFPSSYGLYGAQDEEGYFYTRGAYLNYIAHCGWNLVAVQGTSYYFTAQKLLTRISLS